MPFTTITLDDSKTKLIRCEWGQKLPTRNRIQEIHLKSWIRQALL